MTPVPASLAANGITGERELDVRPLLERGGDPFGLIMKTTAELGSQEALHLVVGFEPRPLYAVMQASGRLAHTEERDGVFHVWFYPDPNAPALAEGPVEAARVPLQEPVEVDVRGLSPPEPMIVILERLVALGEGGRLQVLHHREPHLLYDKLEHRGYAARTTRLPDGDVLVEIAPAWSFEEGETERPASPNGP